MAFLQDAQKLAYSVSKETGTIVKLEKVPILGALGTAVVAITTANKLNDVINDPKGHWVDGVEAFGTSALPYFPPNF